MIIIIQHDRNSRSEPWRVVSHAAIVSHNGTRLEAACKMHNIVKFHYRSNNAALIRLGARGPGCSLAPCRGSLLPFRVQWHPGTSLGAVVHASSRSASPPLSSEPFFLFLFFRVQIVWCTDCLVRV